MATDQPITILGIAGSLRRGSLNQGLVRAAQQVAPAGVTVDRFDLIEIPPYNEDIRQAGEPDPVRQLKAEIEAADGLLISTPEYNHSFSGVLKNAIDWASRPPADSPLAGKPVGLIGASDGMFGTARAQAALRIVLASTGTIVMTRPGIFVRHGQEVADADGSLTDPDTRARLERFMAALADWVRLHGGAAQQ